jgi:hypothetical protein
VSKAIQRFCKISRKATDLEAAALDQNCEIDAPATKRFVMRPQERRRVEDRYKLRGRDLFLSAKNIRNEIMLPRALNILAGAGAFLASLFNMLSDDFGAGFGRGSCGGSV